MNKTSAEKQFSSINKKLETSKKGLQPFQEALNDAHSQLNNKINELESVTNNFNNVLAGSQTATLFLDHKLCIEWFAPAAKKLFDMMDSDIGHPIADYWVKFSDENLVIDAENVLKNLIVPDSEILDSKGNWYLRHMHPYRIRDNETVGVVVTFNDITERKTAAETITEAKIYAEAIVSTIRQPLLVLDINLCIQSANLAFYDLFKVSLRETEGYTIYTLGNGQWNIPSLRLLLDRVLSKNQEIKDYEVEHDFRDLGSRSMLINARKLKLGGGRDELILLAIEDITIRKLSENKVRASEQRLKDLIKALPGAVYTTDAAGRINSYNPAAVELWGREPDVGTDDWCGSWKLYTPDGSPLPHDECPMALALKENRQIIGAEAVAERPDGIRVPFLAFPTPLLDTNGVLVGAVNMLVDITERKQAEALAQRLAAIVESSDDAILSKTPSGIITSWNSGAEHMFGYTSDEIIGNSVMLLVPEERQDEENDILYRLHPPARIKHFETERQRKNGSRFWVSLTISPLENAHGNIFGTSTIARDITERRQVEEHRQLLVHELNHRVKNTLAVVQSIASQTLGHATTMDEARDAFSARLINLAKAHDLLVRESWASVNLAEIVVETVKPHAGGENRFKIKGNNVHLPSSAALAFAMALHELSTNAAKYGALSTANGHVDIVWSVERDDINQRLSLCWSESGGPVVIPPKRKGFGSRLIERALAAELGGEVYVKYEPSGLVCTINAPLPVE